jgi:hypothetical protein
MAELPKDGNPSVCAAFLFFVILAPGGYAEQRDFKSRQYKVFAEKLSGNVKRR